MKHGRFKNISNRFCCVFVSEGIQSEIRQWIETWTAENLYQKCPMQFLGKNCSSKHVVSGQIFQSNLFNWNVHCLHQDANPWCLCKQKEFLKWTLSSTALLDFLCHSFQVRTYLPRSLAHSGCRRLFAHGNWDHEYLSRHATANIQRQCAWSSSPMSIQCLLFKTYIV